jgi:peptidyl-prolyl cis-trans isomerase SurA
LEQLITKRLQLQVAKQAGINVTDTDLDSAIGNIAKQNNMTTSILYERLTQEGMTAKDYRSEIREQITLQKLQQQEVVNRVTITPEEVASFMHSQAWQNNGSKEYRIEDILIPLSDTPSSEEIAAARKRATAVIAKLNQGQNFRSVAQSESGDKHALQGGDLGWRKLPEIPSAFAELVSRMQPKEVSAPIQTPNGFHIIRLAGSRSIGEAQAAPDRKQIESLLLQRKFEEAIQNWVSKLRSQAFIVMNPANQSALA